MRRYFNYLIFILAFSSFLFAGEKASGNTGAAQATNQASDYPNHQQLSKRLQKLADEHPKLVSYQRLTKTAGDKNIWLLTIGKGDIANKPAIAVVGGVSGKHLVGSELALQFAERLLSTDKEAETNELLNRVVFYVFPDMSPDAREQYFAPLRYERLGNARPTDLDRDGKTGEEPYNDLNGDGMISMMRIKDPAGEWMKHPEDERIMVKARKEKGETGNYLLYTEGIAADKDRQFNEDVEVGVFFNRNFTFKYPVFEQGAGENAVSEPETRAIADFLFEAKNVFAVFSFGEANNLSKPLNYNEKDARKRIFTSWKEEDILINKHISELYNKHMGLLAPVEKAGSDGDFFQWAYFHYGRFSFSTQAWSFPWDKANDKDPYESDEMAFLRWAEKHDIKDVFIPWTKVEHEDFPGKTVEVGGMAPFVMLNPPYTMLDSIAIPHTDFIMEVAGMHPSIALTNLKTEKLGKNLHRVTVDITNTGHFPTVSRVGEQLRWVQKTVLRLQLAKSQEMLSGKPVEVIGAIEGQQSESRSWLIHGSGNLHIRAGAESSGFDEIRVDL